MTLRIALLIAAVLAGVAFRARLHDVGVRSAAVSERPAAHNARVSDIVLAAEQSGISLAAPTPILTSALPKQSANPIRTRKGGARFVGTLIVESKPPGAVVMVDQRQVGITPARIAEVPAGSHALWVVRDDHQRWTTAVTVRSSAVTRVIANLNRTE